MGLLKYVNIPVFIISLAVGLFFVYMYQSDKRTVYVYPRPDNIESIQYKDATGTCFKVKQEKMACPKDESMISTIPVQN